MNPGIYRPLVCCMFSLFSICTLAQLVAFSGKDANSPDEFAFVALQDIAPTTIYFTNQDWDNTSGAFVNPGNEGSLAFTNTATILKGTVVQVSETSADMFTVTGATATATILIGDGWSPTAADPHYAFSATGPDPLTTVTEVHAFLNTLMGGATATMDPTSGDNASPNAVVCNFTATQPVGVDYDQDRSTATVATLSDPANFLESFSTTNLTLDLTAFTNPGLPVVLESFNVD